MPGRTTRYDISLLANFTLIPAGDRIQVVLTSQPPANFHAPLAPTPQELANLAGGSYTVDYGARRRRAAASVLDLPLASPGQFSASATDWGPGVCRGNRAVGNRYPVSPRRPRADRALLSMIACCSASSETSAVVSGDVSPGRARSPSMMIGR